MADRYFKKISKDYAVGNTDIVFKYEYSRHDLDSLKERFTECDKSGKTIKKEVKKETKKAKK